MTDFPQHEPSNPSPAQAPTVWQRLLGWVRSSANARLVGVLALLALVGAVWLDGRNRADELQQTFARKLAELDSSSRDSRQLASQARDTLRDVEYKVGMLESRLSETQNQRLALEALYLELSRSRDERVLAEVEQMLLVGNQQLQLAGNVKSALLALETADARLARTEGTQFTALRRAIHQDVERLKAAPFVDVVGMSVRLDTLAHQADALPLGMDLRPQAPPTPPVAEPRDQWALARWARETWKETLSLVRIQSVGGRELPLLSPDQAFFLRENLRMRLLSARVSLLAHDPTGFRADLESASDWLQRYYDTGDKSVSAALGVLNQLRQSDFSVDVPDVSASLEAVRNAKLVRERGLR